MQPDYVATGKQKELAIKKLTFVMALVLGVSGASAFAYDYRNGLDSWRVRDEMDSLRAELH